MASLMKNLAPDYASSKSYSAGDRVLYNNKLYNCTKATTGTFDADCWQDIYLSDLIKGGLNSNLGGKAELLWTNSNPTSVFNEQIISLDLNEYNGVIIEFGRNTTSLNEKMKLYISKSDTSGALGVGGWTNESGIVYTSCRKCSIVSSGVSIGKYYENQNTTPNQNVLIPLKIYGVKTDLV